MTGLYSIQRPDAAPFHKLLSSLLTFFDLRRASSIAGTATSYIATCRDYMLLNMHGTFDPYDFEEDA